MEPTNELLVCRDVSLGYEGQSVLEHLDLTIRRGDYLCIVGDNGSGKSTLLRGLLGLIQPLSGEIWRSPELRQGSLGYLPQQFGYYPGDTPRQFLRYAAALQCIPRREADGRIDHLLETVGLRDAADKKLRKFSGGMLQRVGIAVPL